MDEPVLGYCALCGEPGFLRDDDNGTDMCRKGHTYPTDQAVYGRRGKLLSIAAQLDDMGVSNEVTDAIREEANE